MGDRYIISLACAWCGAMNHDLYYAPSSNFTTFKCRECGKINKIAIGFIATKQESAEQEVVEEQSPPAMWCNGNTPDFESGIMGSNPIMATARKRRGTDG